MIISGHVQGVGYRTWVSKQAQALSLRGWVRNLQNGDVELCAEGEAAVLTQFVASCRRGPPAARVESVNLSHGAATGEFQSFQIRRDS
jgi:acylphosphatase